MWRPALLALCIAYPRSAPADAADNAPARAGGDAPTSAAGHAPARATDDAPTSAADNAPARAADDAPARADDNAPARAADDAPARTADHTAVDTPLLGDDTWQYRSSSHVVIDGGLVVGFPAALPTGLATGVGAGITAGKTLLWGARASWATATESSLPWTVTHSDLRLRMTAGVQAAPGRGTFGLRLGIGGTLVHETRMRNQGMRAGLTGSELETSAFAMLPAADLDAVIALHIAGPWLFVISGGPSIDFHDGKLHGGWNAELGVAWQP